MIILVVYVLIRRRLSVTEKNLNKQPDDGRSIGVAALGSQSRLDASAREESFVGNISVFATTSLNNGSQQKEPTLKQKKRELQKTKRLNKQLIAVMICYLLSFLVAFVLNFRYIIPDFNQRFYYVRQLLRILNVFFQSLIPVVSLYFNPTLTRLLKRAFTTSPYRIRDRNNN